MVSVSFRLDMMGFQCCRRVWFHSRLPYDSCSDLPDAPQVEYAVGPEITETIDPTPEEEEALRKLLMKGQGEGEGGEGGEDDEDEDENED